jgi:hypothetical protein
MSWGGIKRSPTDALFSDFIRERAGWTCERCGRNFSSRRQVLHCSHFYGRRGKSTRWEPDNAAALCCGCHKHFEERPLEHVRFFEKRLGLDRFEALTLRASRPAKYIDEAMIKLWLKQQLESLRKAA